MIFFWQEGLRGSTSSYYKKSSTHWTTLPVRRVSVPHALFISRVSGIHNLRWWHSAFIRDGPGYDASRPQNTSHLRSFIGLLFLQHVLLQSSTRLEPLHQMLKKHGHKDVITAFLPESEGGPHVIARFGPLWWKSLVVCMCFCMCFTCDAWFWMMWDIQDSLWFGGLARSHSTHGHIRNTITFLFHVP